MGWKARRGPVSQVETTSTSHGEGEERRVVEHSTGKELRGGDQACLGPLRNQV